MEATPSGWYLPTLRTLGLFFPCFPSPKTGNLPVTPVILDRESTKGGLVFSNTVMSGISRLLMGSFLHLQLQSTAWAATQTIDLSVRPSESSLPVPASQLFAYRQLQLKQEQDLQNALAELAVLSQLSWTVNVIATVAEAAQTVTSVVFSPFLALQKLLEQSEAEIEQRLKQPIALHDLLEEKKLIDLGEGTSAEISWDGKVKISQTAKNSSELHVQSLTDVILNNVTAQHLSIHAPSVSLHGQADIDKLSIGFNEQGSSVFELGTDSVFRTQDLALNGVLLNKGKIDLKDPAKVKAKSLVNLGTLHSEGALSVETAQLFRNAGKLDASDLQLSAHIFDQVSLPGKEASQIKAQKISVVATESLNLKEGTLEGKQVVLTSCGTFDNKGDVKAQRIQVTTTGEGVQDGLFQADVRCDFPCLLAS